jgi:Na+-transporting NADH:ubiquinone oxidoreductase subunit F
VAAAQLQALLAGTVVFTLTVMLLAIFVLGVRRLLAPSGEATVVINSQRRLAAALGTPLLTLLADNGIYLPRACGGRGACGQCRLRVSRGAPPLTAVEAAHISRQAAGAGDRLACMVVLRGDLAIQLPESMLEARRWLCTVDSSRHITTLMKEIVLRLPDGETIGFRAGNYVLVEAPPHHVRFAEFDVAAEYQSEWQRHGLFELESDATEATQRAYSLANPPAENDRLVLTVRIALPPHDQPPDTPPGRASSWLFSISPGDAVRASGPFGEFQALDSGREMVMIGGGAGIAPLRSIILDQLAGRGSRRRIGFWYGARNQRELCYREEFDELARKHPNFSWQAALSEPGPRDDWRGPTGFIHAVVFERYLRDHHAPEELEYYICGPPVMNTAVLQMLEDLGVDPDSIFLDDFGVAS